VVEWVASGGGKENVGWGFGKCEGGGRVLIVRAG